MGTLSGQGLEGAASKEIKKGRQKLAARRLFHQTENPSANKRRVYPEDHGHILSEHKALTKE